jgi:hypothetical protein
MIPFNLALRSIGGLVLAPAFLVVVIVAFIQLRRLRVQARRTPIQPRRLGNHRIAFALSLLLFFIALLPWIGLFRAAGFDWRPDDVRQVEISVFQSPDPGAVAERSIIIKDQDALSRLFEALGALQPYTSAGHEHAVGKHYALRLCRRSDGRFSDYRVDVYPDKEPTSGGMRMTGVYETSLAADASGVNLGAYEGPELGRLVEQLVEETVARP